MTEKQCRIIHVEDSESDADLLALYVKKMQLPVSLQWLKDGEEAMHFMFSGTCGEAEKNDDLVVLDLSLPRVSGYEVLERMKQDPKWKSKRVIIFSGSNSPADQSRCQNLGANSYFCKPNSLVEYRNFINGPFLSELKQVCAGV